MAIVSSGSVSDILPKTYDQMKEDRLNRSTGDSSIDQDAFLKLLIVQMQNQDPLDPMDNAQFTQQTTAFSQLEQMIGMNKSLTSLVEAQAQNTQIDQSFMNSASFIGKTIEYDTNSLKISSSGSSPISFYASDAAANARVSIYNSEGSLVALVDTGAVKKGQNAIAWDGVGMGGVELQEGMYSFSVSATASDGSTVGISAYGESVVKGVKVSNGTMYFEVENGLVPSENVYGVKQ